MLFGSITNLGEGCNRHYTSIVENVWCVVWYSSIEHLSKYENIIVTMSNIVKI